MAAAENPDSVSTQLADKSNVLLDLERRKSRTGHSAVAVEDNPADTKGNTVEGEAVGRVDGKGAKAVRNGERVGRCVVFGRGEGDLDTVEVRVGGTVPEARRGNREGNLYFGA